MTTRKAPPQISPPTYDVADAYAFQALQRGDASPAAQKRALDWLIQRAAATYDMSFHPENDRLTAFAEGRRFVGNQVLKMLLLDTNKLKATNNG